MTIEQTPAWSVGPWDLEQDLAKIAQQWEPVRTLLADPELYALRADDVSGWSCGEQAGHIVLVSFGIARGIRESFEAPERNREEKLGKAAEGVLTSGGFTRGAVTTTSRLDPEGKGAEAFAPVLPGVVEAWRALSDEVDTMVDCPARFEHMVLGYLSSSEWVRFCAIHTAHHLAVVRDILAAKDTALDVEGWA